MAKGSVIYRIERFLFFFIYLTLGCLISMGFMNQTAGSAGPMSFIFSWGSGLIFLLSSLNKLKGLDFIFYKPIILFITFAAIWIAYLISVVVINSKLMKKNKAFPTLTVIYHFLGVIVSYFFRFNNFEEAGKLYLLLLVYPVLSAMAVLYIYLDWWLAKKLSTLKDQGY